MIYLIPMDESEYRSYLAKAIADYAQDHVNAGNWLPEDALRESEQEFHTLLPDGPATKNQYLFSIRDEAETPVGMLWFAAQERHRMPCAFVYDFKIDERFRRRGYGEQAFQVLEDKVRALGLDTISLHVFGNNRPARALYEKLGYITTNVMMTKQLSKLETD